MEIFDVLILGGGPAGLTSGIYCSRAMLKTAMIEMLMPGGQIANPLQIDNYPGFKEGIQGVDLAEQMEKQARRFGLEIFTGTVKDIDLDSEIKVVKTSGKEYKAKTLIISTGSFPKKINVPGELDFTGRGVSYCGTCDAPFFRDKDVIVIGGGSTSMQESLHLAKFASSVTLFSRRKTIKELKSERILIEKVRDNPLIDLQLHHKLLSINGEKKVQSVILEYIQTKEKKEINIEGVFIFVGTKANTKFLKQKLETADNGAIITNEKMETSVKGVFAAGDVREKMFYQIATAVGDGANAAFSAQHFIEGF